MTSVADIENMILRTSLGDRAAFSSLYNATSAKLFGVCLRILKNRVEAKDALQDVFVKVWQKSSGYAVNGYSPMTWLITVARNLAIDRLRARKAPSKNIDDTHDLVDNGPTPEMIVVQKSERDQIDGCLAELEKAHATAVSGAYFDGDSYQDLADSVGVPINTMRTWLRRSLLKLKDCLTRSPKTAIIRKTILPLLGNMHCIF
jgi:RNA polymerase sigma-70 factor (ECF subfamily)